MSDLSFEEAIAQTQSLLFKIEGGELSESEIETAIASLVKSENGARGFFVTYLTDERPFADNPSPGEIRALQSSEEIVSELLVKNLAMSAAMVVAHRRRLDEKMAASSEKVRSRSAGLIRTLGLSQIQHRAKQMLESAITSEGTYQAFLERWGYDAEQRLGIQKAINPIIN